MVIRRWLAVAALSVAGSVADATADDAYRAEIEAWRQRREASLKAEGGWLSVAGLYWLKDGANRFGTDPKGDIVLPAGSAPARAGVFELAAGRTTVTFEKEVDATLAGRPVTRAELRSDSEGSSPDVIALGRLTLYVIQRGPRYGIRLKDRESPLRKEFSGLRWYEVKEEYRVAARYVTYPEPRMVPVPNILGQSEAMPSPGYAVFERGGGEVRLEGVLEEKDARQLFFIIRDQTSGKETYPAGRFLYADMPKDGRILLDFNKAYNPPCAFTPYATCPLPPPQNWMPLRIEAGELDVLVHPGGAASHPPDPPLARRPWFGLLALRHADHAAAHAAARVAGRLRLEVVRIGVHDHGVSDDAVRTVELHGRVRPLEGGGAVAGRLDVTQVAGVTRRVRGRTVRAALGIEMAAGGCAVRRRAVPELVHVESVAARGQPLEARLDGHAAGHGAQPHRPLHVVALCRLDHRHRPGDLFRGRRGRGGRGLGESHRAQAENDRGHHRRGCRFHRRFSSDEPVLHLACRRGGRGDGLDPPRVRYGLTSTVMTSQVPGIVSCLSSPS
jgi:uncharacterized protein